MKIVAESQTGPLDADLSSFGDEKSQVDTDVAGCQLGKMLKI